MSAAAGPAQPTHHGALTPQGGALVWAALMLLLALTVGAAYVPLGPLNGVVALLIAAAKTVLVATFFMHLRWSSVLVRLAAGAAALWLALLIAFTLSDYITRPAGTVPVPRPTTGGANTSPATPEPAENPWQGTRRTFSLSA